MTIEDDETLQMYVEESQEHLADIESDLLAIEQAGAEIDLELVNKVFRAAHSIKGGAGFMGLTNIKELSHKMENVLGLIRSQEMVPNPEIVNILLLASDALVNLLNNATISNEIDVSEHIEALVNLAEGSLPQGGAKNIPKMLDIILPDGRATFSVPECDVSKVKERGKYLYLVDYDLIHDAHEKGKTPIQILEDMEKAGSILDSKLDVEGIGDLGTDPASNRLPFTVLYATLLDPTVVNTLFEIDPDRIFEVLQGGLARALAGDVEQEAATEDAQPEPIQETCVEKADPGGEESLVEGSQTTQEDQPHAERHKPAFRPAPKEPKVEQKVQEEVCEPAEEKKLPVEAKGPEMEGNLRVNVGLLDSLMNLAGELVLGRNQLLQSIASKDTRAIQLGGQRLDLITSELQEAIMLTRMQPIGNVFTKFQRVVRDLARNLGKQVELTLEGTEVELDKTIIEAISDPLTHLVRNSVDHGIEYPDDRLAAGKDPTGKIRLEAFHEAGQVNIQISDNGKGIDGRQLASMAVEKGLIQKDQVKMMSDKEKVGLIFLPGFSTAKEVTDVSGRGVGMDVVKTNLDKLGGVVDIDSTVGKGTTVRIKLPLTLAIIPSQVVSTAGDRYAIPQVNMDELLRIPAAQIKERVERVGGAEVVRLRGQLLPLLKLSDVLGVPSTYVDPIDGTEKPDRRQGIVDRRSPEILSGAKDTIKETQSVQSETGDTEGLTGQDRRGSLDRRYHADSAVNIVVVSAGTVKYGLVVDQLHDSEEIVVKPLGRHLKHCKGYAGATIMGDGRVALILDVGNLVEMAGLTSVEGTDNAANLAKEVVEGISAKKDMQSLLVFRSSEDEQFAVTLSQVERIEKVRTEDVEELGVRKVMHYRGGSLPLFSIDEVANVKPLAENEECLVIVFILGGKEIGLMATGPVDAIDVSVTVDDQTLRQTGIMGSTIINDRTTQLIDIYGLVEALHADWFEGSGKSKPWEGTAPTILFAEDSAFFRNQVKGFMEDDGYLVIEAEDGHVAWKLMQEHAPEIGAVVTDIEMPNLDGFQLTEKIRADERFSDLPVIALTTLAGEADVARGKQVGIDDYQIKLDREKLMKSVTGYLKKGRCRTAEAESIDS